MIVAVPTLAPDMTPLELTLATEELEDDQVPDGVPSDNVVVVPLQILAVPLIEPIGLVFTVAIVVL